MSRIEDEKILQATRNIMSIKPRTKADWENLKRQNDEAGISSEIQSGVQAIVEPILDKPGARYALNRLQQLAENGFHHRTETGQYDDD